MSVLSHPCQRPEVRRHYFVHGLAGRSKPSSRSLYARIKAIYWLLTTGYLSTLLMAKDLAIVLNNGRINSAVVTAMAAQKHRPILLYAEDVDQGARTRAAYDMQVAHFKPYREHTITMPFLSMFKPVGMGNSAAVSD